MPDTPPTAPEYRPLPTADRALISALTEAYVATHSKSESLTFLRMVARILADREEKARVVLSFRRKDREAAQAEAEANQEAMTIFRHMLEGCVARLMESPDDDT